MSVRAQTRTILDGVDLAVAAGSMAALAGPSGAGKTTLLRVIAGLCDPTRGTVELRGRPVTHLAPAKRRLGYVFQEPRLFPSLDIADNVSFALRRDGVRRAERRRRARHLLERVGLGGRDAEAVHRLSGGEQQRVALARALCGEPEVLLLDEPFAALDPHRRSEGRDLVAALHATDRVTTVLVTHDLADAVAVADTVAVLDAGRLVQHERPGHLLDRPATTDVARLTGNPNHWHGTATAGLFAAGPLRLPVTGPDGPATVTCRPERIHVGGPTPAGATGTARATGTVAGTVRSAIRSLAGTEIVADTAAGPVTARTPPGRHRPATGDAVTLTVPPDALWRFPDPHPGP